MGERGHRRGAVCGRRGLSREHPRSRSVPPGVPGHRGFWSGARRRESAGTAAPVPAPWGVCRFSAGKQRRVLPSAAGPGSSRGGDVPRGLQDDGCPRFGLGSVPCHAGSCKLLGPCLPLAFQVSVLPVHRAAADADSRVPAAPGFREMPGTRPWGERGAAAPVRRAAAAQGRPVQPRGSPESPAAGYPGAVRHSLPRDAALGRPRGNGDGHGYLLRRERGPAG